MTTPNQPLRPHASHGAGVPVPHLPTGVGPVGQPVNSVDWFRRMPTGGGTVFLRPAGVEQND
ncbi:hypothetical protein [Lentzea sp. NPDC051838]|uniref:hypothetical protein n=1 Tax=Lentzea sp. NPDC051838 TaxID=3154849 RepID=UPI0034423975